MISWSPPSGEELFEDDRVEHGRTVSIRTTVFRKLFFCTLASSYGSPDPATPRTVRIPRAHG